jgi:CubicO group peptidase (beta-lactamase class C family)
MKIPKHLLTIAFVFCVLWGKAQLYFPPVSNTSPWDTISPASLGWCTSEIPALYSMLEQKNTKAFIVLKNGKIAMEKYFGTFTIDSSWYWASAGKTLTSFMVGQAQEKNLLSIEDSSSKYLGKGFTSCTPEKEGLIKIRHQLSMTTGLDEKVTDLNCTDPACLKFAANAGTKWYYHNAPYRLLQNVVANASGLSFQQFTNQNLSAKTGIYGLWINDVFYSKPRNMARFGLLVLNKGVWGSDTLLKDKNYFNAMTTTSQNLNQAYGYLWWLNGKSTFMLPGTTLVLNGSLVPPAPAEMIAALGKNDQKLYVIPSQNLVVIRMGEDGNGNTNDVPIQLDSMIWNRLNKVICKNTALFQMVSENTLQVYPNPVSNELHIIYPSNMDKDLPITVCNYTGRVLGTYTQQETIPMAQLAPGIYFVQCGTFKSKIIKE